VHASLRSLIIFNSSTDSIMKPATRCSKTSNPQAFVGVVSSDQIRGMFWVVTGTMDG